MNFTVVHRMQLNQTVERILHVPGNYSGGQLEMTIVVDPNMDREQAAFALQNIATALKTHSDVFKNVRLNLVRWESDSAFKNEIVPLIKLTMSSFYQEMLEKDEAQQRENEIKGEGSESDYSETVEKKIWLLYDYLKRFHARSKLILLVSDGNYRKPETEEEEKLTQAALEPFLGKKLAGLIFTEEHMEIRYRTKA